LRFGLLTRDERGWCSMQLLDAMKRLGVGSIIFRFPDMVARVGCRPAASLDGEDLLGLDALIIRPIGRGSLEEIIFRMDLLYRLERLGLLVVNPPKSIERAVDKYFALALLEEAGLPVPRTIVTESSTRALNAFQELGGDVVIKPIFGSRGIGSTRVSDYDVAERIFRALSFHHEVIYIQEYIEHGFSDIRAFVLGDRVLASMRRVADRWKTNVSQGARPEPIRLDEGLEELAVRASKAVGCMIAGVDILEGRDGPRIVEVNSQPGWMGLQQVTETRIADEIIRYIMSEIKR
jgi:RimK family alpha-L-glutamate ligase